VRARFRLDHGAELRFDDARKFGRLFLVDQSDNGYQPPWDRLGIEPLSSDLSVDGLAARLRNRRAAIKTILLNQAVIAGIGNIYADESLFLASIHPARPAGSLSRGEVESLCSAVRTVLSGAIDERGTTFSTYRDIDGSSGRNQRKLLVFHRNGQPCPRCQSHIGRTVLGGRGTHFCPGCQV